VCGMGRLWGCVPFPVGRYAVARGAHIDDDVRVSGGGLCRTIVEAGEPGVDDVLRGRCVSVLGGGGSGVRVGRVSRMRARGLEGEGRWSGVGKGRRVQ